MASDEKEAHSYFKQILEAHDARALCALFNVKWWIIRDLPSQTLRTGMTRNHRGFKTLVAALKAAVSVFAGCLFPEDPQALVEEVCPSSFQKIQFQKRYDRLLGTVARLNAKSTKNSNVRRLTRLILVKGVSEKGLKSIKNTGQFGHKLFASHRGQHSIMVAADAKLIGDGKV